MKRLVIALLLALVATPVEAVFDETTVPVSPSGTPATIDLPVERHVRNTGGMSPLGPGTGAGLCVFTSTQVAADWQNLPEMAGFQKWMTRKPGGGYPSKLDAMIKEYCAEKHFAIPAYVQHTGGDVRFLELCMATRRSPGITYCGIDDFYGRAGRIYHMVNLAHRDSRDAAIIDNNRPGKWEWMSPKELDDRWLGVMGEPEPRKPWRPFRQGMTGGHDFGVPVKDVGDGWAFVWLAPPPPPKDGDGKVGPPKPKPIDVVWVRGTNDKGKDVWLAYRGNTLLGAWDGANWYKAVGPSSVERTPSPLPVDIVPPTPAPVPTPTPSPKPCPGPYCPRPSYLINGVPATFEQVTAAMLTDDSDRYHLSFVGVDGKAVANWFGEGGPLAKYSGRVHVQVYTKGDWVVADRLTDAVTLQEPAKVGGKKVGVCKDVVTVDCVKSILSAVFDPPTPTPAPAPQPKGPDVAPAPREKPAATDDGIVSIPKKGIDIFLFAIAILTGLLWRKN